MSDNVEQLAEQLLGGNRRAVARLITLVERGGAASEQVVQRLYPHTGQAHIIGVTGAPGAGKSTLVNQLALALRQKQQTVAIIAVDPSSPFSGGALLGDRIRMGELYGDKGIFIRSMASRGHLGGLAVATGDALRVLDAAGYDRILIETVGAGQAEVDIARAAQTTLVIEAPGMGDDVQTIKAGILEIADVLVVNKSDRPERESTVRALRAMLRLGQDIRARSGANHAPQWDTPIVETIATTGEGIEKLVIAVDAHQDYLQKSGEGQRRARANARRELELLLWRRLQQRWHAQADAMREDLINALVERRTDPYSAAKELLQQLGAAL